MPTPLHRAASSLARLRAPAFVSVLWILALHVDGSPLGARNAAAACSDTAFAQAKTARMRYGLQWLLPQGAVHWGRASTAALVLPQVHGPQ